MPPVSHGRRGAVPLTSSHPTSCQVREGGKDRCAAHLEGCPSRSIPQHSEERYGSPGHGDIDLGARSRGRPVRIAGARTSGRDSKTWPAGSLRGPHSGKPSRPPTQRRVRSGRIAAGAVPRPGVGSLEPAPETPPGCACGARPGRWTGRAMRRWRPRVGRPGFLVAVLVAGHWRDDRMARDVRGRGQRGGRSRQVTAGGAPLAWTRRLWSIRGEPDP
jgi:hypothetical protein